MIGIIILAGCSNQNLTSQNYGIAQNNATNTGNNKNTSSSSTGDTTPYGLVQAKILGLNPYSNDTDGDGVPDKQDSNPNQADMTITSSGSDGFAISSAIVENNVDPTTQTGVSDHLEITLHSTAASDIKNVRVYYSIKDITNGRTESYIVPLSGFVLKAGSTETIHFDAQKSANEQFPQNHFAANPNSMYYLNSNALEFNIIIAADGYNAQTIKVTKAAGGAEQAD